MHSSPRRSRRWLFSLLVLLIVIGLCWKFWPMVAERIGKRPEATAGQAHGKGDGKGSGAGVVRPGFGGSDAPVPVRVAPAMAVDFPVYYKALGTVTSLNTVNVKTRVDGELMKIAFQEGQPVKAGDLLVQIDPRTYQIALQQAEGTLAENQALLQNAQIDLKRYQGLFAEDSIAKQTLDTQVSQVNQYQGTIKTNQAAVNQAKLNLQFTDIRSPIAGRAGLRQVDIGNQISTGDATPLLVITQTKPISVVFTLPEASLEAVIARYRSGDKLPVEAWSRGDSSKLATGVLASLDNQIDTTTGTLKFKARFDNADETLLPNQFVNARLLADTLKNATVVPSAAVQFGNNGPFVYVMDGDNKVLVRPLQIGASDADNTVVKSGVVVGDRVVLEGTDRLRDGSAVEVVSDSKEVPVTPGQHLQGSTGVKQAAKAGKDAP